MKEKISTLLDNELDLNASGQTVSKIINDKILRERFETYQLIRDSMRNELMDATFSSQSILDAIEKEPIQIQFNKHKKLSEVTALSSPDWMSLPIAASFIAFLFVGATIIMNTTQLNFNNATRIAQDIPREYIEAHQMLAPTNVAFYVEPQAK